MMKSKLQHFLLATGLCIAAIPFAAPVKAALNNGILLKEANTAVPTSPLQQSIQNGSSLALAQSSSWTQIRVTISRAVALDDLDDGVVGTSALADFYAEVSIDGVAQLTPTSDNDNDITPNWQKTQWVPKGKVVPITIKLMDDDSGNSDDPVDIFTGTGTTIQLWYNTATGVITESDGTPVGFKNYKLRSFGDEGSDRGGIIFSISND